MIKSRLRRMVLAQLYVHRIGLTDERIARQISAKRDQVVEALAWLERNGKAMSKRVKIGGIPLISEDPIDGLYVTEWFITADAFKEKAQPPSTYWQHVKFYWKCRVIAAAPTSTLWQFNTDTYAYVFKPWRRWQISIVTIAVLMHTSNPRYRKFFAAYREGRVPMFNGGDVQRQAQGTLKVIEQLVRGYGQVAVDTIDHRKADAEGAQRFRDFVNGGGVMRAHGTLPVHGVMTNRVTRDDIP